MTTAVDLGGLPAPTWDHYPDRRAARRAAVRRHHPDVGGSAAELIGALTEIDAHFSVGRPQPAAEEIIIVSRGAAARRMRTRMRRWSRRRRAHHYIAL